MPSLTSAGTGTSPGGKSGRSAAQAGGRHAKTFTATVVLQLIAQCPLRLDDKIDRWLPGVMPDGKGITLLHLLNHTSGLYNYTNDVPDAAAIVRDRFMRWAQCAQST
jgi:D-alanyl-D-alanine carboxypeptidase